MRFGSRDPIRVDRGSSVVEVVFVVPVAMFLLMLAVQFALWAHGEEVVQLAASSGERVATAYGSTPADGSAEAQSVLQGPGSSVSDTEVSVMQLPGDFERVSVSGRVATVVPGLDLHVSAIEMGPRQEFRSTE